MKIEGYTQVVFAGELYEIAYITYLLRELPFTRVRDWQAEDDHRVQATISLDDYEAIKTKFEDWKSKQ